MSYIIAVPENSPGSGERMPRRGYDPFNYDDLFSEAQSSLANARSSFELSSARFDIDWFIRFDAPDLQKNAQILFDHLDYGSLPFNPHSPVWLIGPSAHNQEDVLLVQDGHIVKQNREAVTRTGLSAVWTASKLITTRRHY